ncbi:MAG: di-heme oxidoredictase family protein, partial [Paracoccaceae bacterium]|nr:di-heme oxidoredictase family protein [Paracoccaceae bacterium]
MMTPLKSFVALLALVGPAVADDAARVAAVTAWTTDFSAPEPFEARPAGAATVTRFADPAATLDPARRMDFALGAAVFEKLWVAAPSSTRASDGLGPLFNARSCAGCHPGTGRGTPPPTPGAISGLVLKLATPDGHPDPLRGSQLQDRAVLGVPAEGALTLEWSETRVVLAGGDMVALRSPLARVTPDLAPGTQTSLRVAPQLIGLGLLEVVADADILALADPDDADGDGISGRAAWVHSPSLDAQALGRFGHRAGAASLRDMA